MTGRYEGKPLLRLLELYVLWCIGKLAEDHRLAMEKMAPYLNQTYNRGGTWQEVLESVMELPPNMPELVKATWVKVRTAAAADGSLITPDEFSKEFVDHNLR